MSSSLWPALTACVCVFCTVLGRRGLGFRTNSSNRLLRGCLPGLVGLRYD